MNEAKRHTTMKIHNLGIRLNAVNLLLLTECEDDRDDRHRLARAEEQASGILEEMTQILRELCRQRTVADCAFRQAAALPDLVALRGSKSLLEEWKRNLSGSPPLEDLDSVESLDDETAEDDGKGG